MNCTGLTAHDAPPVAPYGHRHGCPAQPEAERRRMEAADRAACIRALGWVPEDGTAAGRYCATAGEMVGYLRKDHGDAAAHEKLLAAGAILSAAFL